MCLIIIAKGKRIHKDCIQLLYMMEHQTFSKDPKELEEDIIPKIFKL